MASNLYLPPAKLHPRLTEIISQGDLHAKNAQLTESELADWVTGVLFVLTKVEHPGPMLIEHFENIRAHVARRSDQAIPEDLRRQGLFPALVALRAQADLIDAEIDPIAPNHSNSKGHKVFIGHGRDPAWMELREFLSKDLHIQVVEFNSEPTAGRTIIDRLKEMLDTVGFAFLIMTAEDHVGQKKDAIRARQNVIHEIGLFQGRLGFSKAIILLEVGCAQFSNVDGLIYIPFPKGNIKAAFYDIQKTLTAAGLVNAVAP